MSVRPASAHELARFWPYLLRGLVIVVAAATLAACLHQLGLLERLELLNLDTWLLSKRPEPAMDVLLVTIEQTDYKELFNSQSPLDQRTVINIINKIAEAKPRVIGVDLDTSDWNPGLKSSLAANVPIVWARDAQEDEAGPVGTAKQTEKDKSSRIKLGNVFGENAAGDCWGLAAIAPDDDAIVRSYYRRIPMSSSEGEEYEDGTYISFVAAVSRAADTQRCPFSELQTAPPKMPELLKRINFLSWRINRLSVSAVLKLAELSDWRASPEKFPEINQKLVLLGGAFRQARDRYRTPIGGMDGVEILGQALLTERGHGFREAGVILMAAIDVIVGVALISLNYLLMGWMPRSAIYWMLPLKFLFLPLVASLISLAAFLLFSYYASFFPVVLGVFVHELLEHAIEHRNLLQENEKLKAESAKGLS